MIPTTFLSVGLGGAIGVMCRYGVALWIGGATATLAVNVIGSFLMGCAFVALAAKGFDHWQPLVMTGILGGFTTFSAFSLDAFKLIERGDIAQAAIYIALSVGLSIAALVAGILIMRGVLT